MSPDGTVSKSDFARLRGVTPAMVTKWIKQGRVVLTEDGKRVVAAPSLARIEQQRDPSRGGVGGRPAGSASYALPAELEAGGGGAPAGGRGPASYAQVRTAREAYGVKQAELDYRERVGELIERKAYDRALADGLAPIVAGLETLSARIGPELAAETDPRKVQNLLDAAVAALRRDIADTLRRMISGAGVRQ